MNSSISSAATTSTTTDLSLSAQAASLGWPIADICGLVFGAACGWDIPTNLLTGASAASVWLTLCTASLNSNDYQAVWLYQLTAPSVWLTIALFKVKGLLATIIITIASVPMAVQAVQQLVRSTVISNTNAQELRWIAIATLVIVTQAAIGATAVMLIDEKGVTAVRGAGENFREAATGDEEGKDTQSPKTDLNI